MIPQHIDVEVTTTGPATDIADKGTPGVLATVSRSLDLAIQ